MEQELFSTAQIAAELEHKSTNPRRDVLNIGKRLGFTPVATRPREGKNPGGKPEMLWSKEQKDAILDYNRKRYTADNIQDARADLTAGTTDTVAPVTVEEKSDEIIALPTITDISTIAPAPVVITLDERANRIRVLRANIQRGIFQIGFELIAAKEQVGHGGWGEWLKHEFNWTQRTANNFMRVAKRFGKMENVFQFQPATFQAMLTLPAGTEQEFIDAQAAAGKPVETQSARDVKKSVKEFKSARATAKKTAEEPTPDLSNRGEKFSIFGRETAEVTHDDRPVVSEPVAQDSAKQEETATDDVAQFNVVTHEQLIALRQLVTGTNNLQTLKKIRDSIADVIKLADAKIGELAQKK